MAIKFLFRALLCAGYGLVCAAQQPASRPQPEGLETPWDVRTTLADLTKNTADLKPAFDALAPQQWYDKKGAPSTYILQLQSAQQQLRDVAAANKMASAQTESLSLAMDYYFRLEALEFVSRSLAEGADKYADRATASRLNELIARNFSDRQKYRAYIRDLAESLEQNFKIADEEAQRCRGIISKEPPARTKASHP